MSAVGAIKGLFAVPEEPDLVLAQARALSRQVPLMYAMVVVNMVILAATHIGTAPDSLAIYVPAVLTLVSIVRILTWWRSRNDVLHDVAKARASIVAMMRVMPILSIGFSVWTIGLLSHGDAYQQSQVVFFCGITTIGCMFCLMHVRAAALTMGAVALLPFSIVMLAMNNIVLTAIAINLAAVVVVLLVVLLGNYRDFAALVASRAAIAQKQAETQRLSDEHDRLANVDTLTHLPNRRSFDRELTGLLDSQDADDALAVVRLDLDNFKSINEIFGQITGDRVLMEVARRLTMLRPKDSFVARLGADNFALIVRGPVTAAMLSQLGTVLCRAMRSSFDVKGANIHLSASVGLAASRRGDTAETLYDRADYVTSVAKGACRGEAVVFAEHHQDDISKLRRMEHALHTADLEAEIGILFQQQFDTALNCTTGYEVLARWHSPTLGAVSPAEFIPLAERTGMIYRITQTVLAKALAASARLPKHIRLSVNLSANDVGSTPATEAIVAMIEAAGLPARIDFEITETAMMRDMKQTSEALAALLSLGSRIALDDFGTGHSSLTHVQMLPLDRIKIDRSFVADIDNDATSRAIVKTMVDMCRNLGISCVFEGVETQDQLGVLKDLGGTLMQGYLFGRPIAEADMLAQVSREQASWDASSIAKLGAAR